jgi:hypothetical protein
MEPDMAIEMLKTIQESDGVRGKNIVMDGDTSVMSRIRKEVDATIAKLEDKNHLHKSLRTSLYKLQKMYNLKTPVIKYLEHNFRTMISTNQNNAEGIAKGLEMHIVVSLYD